jgi:hypothetical protein
LIVIYRKPILLTVFILGLVSLGCGFVEPIRQRIAAIGQPTPTPTLTLTPRPTFTATPDWTATPTITLTPTSTATPTQTPTPTETPTLPPSATPTETPIPPTNTPRPPTPIPPSPTPAPPTNTPPPNYPYKIAEGPLGFPTSNSILVMYIGLTDGNNVPVGGLKVVGDHQPSGTHWESQPSCFDFCKVNGIAGTRKFGNVTFEPPSYETGTWYLRVVDGGGAQVSDVIPIQVDFNSPGWFFMLLRRS